jgi:hypothetical protein
VGAFEILNARWNGPLGERETWKRRILAFDAEEVKARATLVCVIFLFLYPT